MTDRAAEIAREIAGGTALTVDPCDAEAIRDEHVALEQAIAAALRSYAEERLEEWRQTTAENNVPDGV